MKTKNTATHRPKIRTFANSYFEGKVRLGDINDFVDIWHTLRSDNRSLHDFLGMTKNEYAQWIANPRCLMKIMSDKITKLALCSKLRT